MDTNVLHSCLEATLQADANTRMQAELQLKEAEKAPGFITSCLAIVVEPRVSDPVKSAAAVYLKNKISKGWSTTSDSSISEEEKPIFRQQIIPALIKSSHPSRQVLVKILNLIVAKEFPRVWPEFLNVTMDLFQKSNNDIDSIRVGLTCLLEICKYYRWTIKEQREGLDVVIDHTFPGVLTIGNSLVNENSNVAGEMLRDVLKIYKCVTYQALPERLQEPKEMNDWGSLMLSVVRKELPEEVLKLSEEDREHNPWVKCKKWALANLHRLFYRYATPRKISRSAEYTKFSALFINNYVPEILKVYFEQIDLWVQKKIWLGNASLYNILAFFEECIPLKTTWVILKPHIDVIVTHVVFPLLCTSDNDLEIFESDPEEYIHKHIDVYEESPTPDVAATNFLVTLIKKRSKHTLNNLLSFVQTVVNRHLADVNDLQLAREQEAALRIMGSISHIVLSKKSPIADQMETFISQYVFPDLSSPHGFLRARACEFLNHYADVDFQNVDNISIAYRSVIACMEDENLPVQVEAALALQPMVRHDAVRSSLSQSIPEVMTRLLDLANKIDIDAIAGIIGEFVEVFSEQLTPFAVDLARKMSDQLLRLLNELIEQQNIDFDTGAYDDNVNEEKTMTALGILNTMSTLLLALDNAVAVVIELENILKPVIELIFNERLSEFYSEVFGLIENCTYCLKSISPTMWSLFVQMHIVFKEDAIDYLAEMFPSIDNYLQYGTKEISENQQFKDILYDIFDIVMSDTNNNLGSKDRSYACSIAQKMLLGLKGHIDDIVPQILKQTTSRLTNDEPEKLKNAGYLVNLLEVILASLCYNPRATLSFLENAQLTEHCFKLWFDNLDKFKRVYDLKLVVLAMLSLFSLPDEDLPNSIRSSLAQISKALVSVLKKYPEAVKHRMEVDIEFDKGIDPSASDMFYEEWNEEDDELELEGEDSVAGNNNATGAGSGTAQEYLDFLDAEAKSGAESAGMGEDLVNNAIINDYYSSDDLEEEPLSETILDTVDPNAAVKNFLLNLKESGSVRYQVLTGQFTQEEVAILEAAMGSC